jgi:hypothetical protein
MSAEVRADLHPGVEERLVQRVLGLVRGGLARGRGEEQEGEHGSFRNGESGGDELPQGGFEVTGLVGAELRPRGEFPHPRGQH